MEDTAVSKICKYSSIQAWFVFTNDLFMAIIRQSEVEILCTHAPQCAFTRMASFGATELINKLFLRDSSKHLYCKKELVYIVMYTSS